MLFTGLGEHGPRMINVALPNHGTPEKSSEVHEAAPLIQCLAQNKALALSRQLPVLLPFLKSRNAALFCAFVCAFLDATKHYS